MRQHNDYESEYLALKKYLALNLAQAKEEFGALAESGEEQTAAIIAGYEKALERTD